MDKEQLIKQIEELNTEILFKSLRSSGRTYGIANDIIYLLFAYPVGRWIDVVDHNQENSRDLVDMLTRRLKNDFPQIKFTIDCSNDITRIKRETKLPKEVELEELEKRRQELLNQTLL